MGALTHPFLPCARHFLILYGAMLALYSGLNLRGENGGGIPVSRSDRRMNRASCSKAIGVILNGQSAEIDDRASAANGVPAQNMYNIEQLKVILKSRVWDAEEEAGQHGDCDKPDYCTELSIDIHGILKTGILKGSQRRRRSHRTQPRFDNARENRW